jgi:hypothetical protein
MSVGGEILLDAGSRSAWARPADMTHGGWLGSAPEGAYHNGLAGQIRIGRCAGLGFKASSYRRNRPRQRTDPPKVRRYGLINEYTRAA